MDKRIIAPVLIGILICLYYSTVLYSIVFMGEFNLLVFIINTVFVISVVSMMVHVVKQRINEIKGGEEDDLSKY